MLDSITHLHVSAKQLPAPSCQSETDNEMAPRTVPFLSLRHAPAPSTQSAADQLNFWACLTATGKAYGAMVAELEAAAKTGAERNAIDMTTRTG